MKKTLKIAFVFLIIAFNLVVTNDSNAQVVKTKIVNNLDTKWGNEQKIKLEFIQKIGGLDEIDENFQFYQPLDAAVDNLGNIYVLDHGNKRVQKFSPTGKYLQTIGRKGQGPGELSYPLSLFVDKKSNIIIGEGFSGKVLFIGQDGKEYNRFYEINLHAVLNNGNFLGTLPYVEINYKNDTNITKELFGVYSSEGKLIDRIGKRKVFTNIHLTKKGSKISVNVNEQNEIFVSYRHRNLIEKYSENGNLLLSISRKKDFQETNLGEPRRMKIVGGSGKLKTMGGLIHPPDMNEFSRNIEIDSQNRIWTHTVVKQKKGKATEKVALEVYDDNGILLTRIDFPEVLKPTSRGLFDTQLMRIFGDKIYFIDMTGEMCVYEYKIIN